jgi:hypothetical protein
MAILYLDSFSTYNTAGINQFWTQITNNSAITAGAGRRGGPALTGVNTCAVQRAIPNSATVVVGAAFKFTGVGPVQNNDFIILKDGTTTQVRVEYATGILRITGPSGVLATGSTNLINGGVYYVEFKATIADAIAANSCVLRLNGVVECTAPAGSDTKATANAFANSVTLMTAGANFVPQCAISDLYILDGTGAVNNDFLGDKRVEPCFPAAAGTATNWTPTGAAANWDCVNEAVADGDTTYVAGATVGQYDTYALQDLVAGAAAVNGVQVRLVARKDDAGSRALAPALRVNGTNYDGATIALGDGYLPSTQAWDLNPDTAAAWTDAQVNALEAGVKLVS